MKNVFVLQLLAEKCHAFAETDMKVLEIYFESEAKIMYCNIFLTYFLDRLTRDCNSENTIFPAQIIINFKMGKKPKQKKTPKMNPKLEYVHIFSI